MSTEASESMNRTSEARRRIVKGILMATGAAFFGVARAQNEPGPPAPPGSIEVDGTEISRESYDNWLRRIKAVAEEAAAQIGVTIDDETTEKFDEVTIKTLNENGYKVPNPPTNLRVE